MSYTYCVQRVLSSISRLSRNLVSEKGKCPWKILCLVSPPLLVDFEWVWGLLWQRLNLRRLLRSSRNSHSCNDASKGMLKGKTLKMFWKSRHIVWIRDRPATRFKTNIIFLLSCLPKVLRKLEYRRSDVNSPAIKCKLRVRIHRPFGTFIGLQLTKLLSVPSQQEKIEEGVWAGGGGGGEGEFLTC